MAATLEGPPVLCGGAWACVPQSLRDLTTRMLARDPEARFANGGCVLAALRELTVGMPPSRPSLPTATAQPLGEAPTQLAHPLRPPGRTHHRVAAKRFVLASAAAVGAVVMGARPS